MLVESILNISGGCDTFLLMAAYGTPQVKKLCVMTIEIKVLFCEPVNMSKGLGETAVDY